MFDIVPVQSEKGYAIIPAETALVASEESIFVDTDTVHSLRSKIMFDIVPVQSEKGYAIIPAETALVASEESIFVDTDTYHCEDDMEFFIMIAGKKVGTLNWYARRSKEGKVRPNAPFWAARISDVKNYSIHSCLGHGKTVDEAIADALDDIDAFRAAASFALKVRAKVKRNPKCVSLEVRKA